MADDEMSPSPPAALDPRLPLTAMQVFKLKKSWKGVKRSLDDTGVEMFIRLFRSKPPLQRLFRELRGVPVDELRVSEAMEKHAGRVMAVFDDAINAIENVDGTDEILCRAAKKHSSIEGFVSDMFWDIEQPFLDAVRITLGDRYTDNMDGIYRITIKYLLEKLVRGHRALAS
ncbi:globin-3-like [Pomacea canaliculata]|uniref:globin-3-like n=1 Tax=Pomacea canaliculata TaxID=400727 RepID=UPI000D73846F|nr:globin-3-like [Pomacea canaliculata]